MKKMLSGLLFLSLILISCSGNDPELKAAPEAVVDGAIQPCTHIAIAAFPATRFRPPSFIHQ